MVAEDRDAKEFGRVTYAIDSSTNDGTFAINQTTGQSVKMKCVMSHKQAPKTVLFLSASFFQNTSTCQTYINVIVGSKNIVIDASRDYVKSYVYNCRNV